MSLTSLLGFNFGSSKSKSTTDQTQVDNSSQTGRSVGTVNAPKWWQQGTEDLNSGVNAFAQQYGYGNLTPTQQQGLTSLTNINAKNYGSDVLKNAVNPALQGIAGSYTPMANVNYSLTGGTPQSQTYGVTASTGVSMAQPYIDAYGTGVLDPTLADYDTGVARAANSYRAGTLTQAPGTRQSIASAVLAGDAARGRASTEAGIRSDILDKSFGFGGNDAGMKLSADTTTANNAQQASEANTGRAQQDRLANLQAQIQGDSTKMAALNNMAQLVQQIGQNALNGDTAESQNAIALLQASGIPVEQALQLIQAQGGTLNFATPGFGQTTDTSGTTNSTSNMSGTSTGNASGFSFGGSNKKA